MKFEEILIEIMVLEKGAIELLRRKRGRFKFPVYINENLYNTSIDALDLMTVLLSYVSLHSYEENESQSRKLDTIIFDMEHKLEYQNKLLNEILRKVERIENGRN